MEPVFHIIDRWRNISRPNTVTAWSNQDIVDNPICDQMLYFCSNVLHCSYLHSTVIVTFKCSNLDAFISLLSDQGRLLPNYHKNVCTLAKQRFVEMVIVGAMCHNMAITLLALNFINYIIFMESGKAVIEIQLSSVRIPFELIPVAGSSKLKWRESSGGARFWDFYQDVNGRLGLVRDVMSYVTG